MVAQNPLAGQPPRLTDTAGEVIVTYLDENDDGHAEAIIYDWNGDGQWDAKHVRSTSTTFLALSCDVEARQIPTYAEATYRGHTVRAALRLVGPRLLEVNALPVATKGDEFQSVPSWFNKGLEARIEPLLGCRAVANGPLPIECKGSNLYGALEFLRRQVEGSEA